ncbi:MAG: hypothetical protein IT557_16325 [Alphaproteobacteria bacterium]|nr:hypothetical protein [Alphaproteobacteria bacterium]
MLGFLKSMLGRKPAGAGPTEAEQSVSLPQGLVDAVSEPIRSAILSTFHYFCAAPDSLVGRPAEVAKQAALIEYLLIALPQSHMAPDFGRDVTDALAEGRAALRGALGIAPDVSGARVIEALAAAAPRLARGDTASAQASLGAVAGADAALVVQAMAHLPRLPALAEGVRRARDVLQRTGSLDTSGR